MSFKNQLLNAPKLAPLTVTMLGGEFNVQRLSAARLNKHDKAIRAHQANQDGEKLNTESAQFLLDSILDEDGQPMANSVTAKQLMESQTMTAISAAVNKIVNLNFMGEDAEATAKKA